MLNPELYKDSVIEQISKYTDSVTPEDALVIGDIVLNILTQYKADLIDRISIDCVSGVKERLEQTLSLLRTA